MQGVKIRNDLFSPSNVKCFAVNNFATNSQQKKFMNSVQNVRHTLGCLERSIKKSNEYEQRLLHCRGSHKHSHGINDWTTWDSEHSDQKSFKCSNTTSTTNTKSSTSQDGCTDTWSSMSIVCLQYQYEELAKRYRALIQAYDEQCYAVGMRDKRLAKWRQRVNTSHAHLAIAHTSLLAVGEKYLAIKEKRKMQVTFTWWTSRPYAPNVMGNFYYAHSKRVEFQMPEYVFPDSYNLGVFKSRVNRFLLGKRALSSTKSSLTEKKWYEDQLRGMRQSLQDMMDATTQARMKFDARLEKCMASESDSDAALLLYEIRKCNLLFLENMQLKALIQQLIPGQLKWKL